MFRVDFIKMCKSKGRPHELAVSAWSMSNGYSTYVSLCDLENVKPLTLTYFNTIWRECQKQLDEETYAKTYRT